MVIKTLILACVLLAGCAGMLSPDPPPADWPELQYTINLGDDRLKRALKKWKARNE